MVVCSKYSTDCIGPIMVLVLSVGRQHLPQARVRLLQSAKPSHVFVIVNLTAKTPSLIAASTSNPVIVCDVSARLIMEKND